MISRKVELADGVIILRPFCLDDAYPLYQAVRESIPAIKPWMSWCTESYSEEYARQWISILPDSWSQGTTYAFAITDQGDGSILGGCSLSHVNTFYRLANLGYWVRSSRTRQGIASRAARLIARFAFEKVGLIRVEIVVARHNRASLRVAEKVGATREGVLRNRLIVREKFLDAVMHSLIPQDLDL